MLRKLDRAFQPPRALLADGSCAGLRRWSSMRFASWAEAAASTPSPASCPTSATTWPVTSSDAHGDRMDPAAVAAAVRRRLARDGARQRRARGPLRLDRQRLLPLRLPEPDRHADVAGGLRRRAQLAAEAAIRPAACASSAEPLSASSSSTRCCSSRSCAAWACPTAPTSVAPSPGPFRLPSASACRRGDRAGRFANSGAAAAALLTRLGRLGRWRVLRKPQQRLGCIRRVPAKRVAKRDRRQLRGYFRAAPAGCADQTRGG